MGVGDHPGKLGKYAGRCGLWNWLVRVAKNFSADWGIARATDSGPLEGLAVVDKNPAEENECRQLLGGAVREAIATLAPEQGTLLYFLFAEGLPGKDVAGILGVHPGQVSRRKERAIERLREALASLGGPSPQGRAYRDCLESLTGTRNWRELAGVFLRTLTKFRPADDAASQEPEA